MLVAIAIPVFTTQLERSREATDISNIRAAYAEAVSDYLSKGADEAVTAEVETIQQQKEGWDIDDAALYTRVNGSEKKIDLKTSLPTIKNGQSAYVHVAADGTVAVNHINFRI